MNTEPSLHPTLWRTCRVLANRKRLQLLQLLLAKPDQTVSALAGALKLKLPTVSQYLRALEARGLLTVKRKGRMVSYRASTDGDGAAGASLVAALRTLFQRRSEPVEEVFKMATAFTHPRRIEIFRALTQGPQVFAQVSSATRVSGRALFRHLRKLEKRGFVKHEAGKYEANRHADGLGRELARLATET